MTKLEDYEADDKSEVKILPSEFGRRSADIIREYVVEKADYIDFIFVGNTGADFSSKEKEKYLGSVARELVCNTKINVFFMC